MKSVILRKLYQNENPFLLTVFVIKLMTPVISFGSCFFPLVALDDDVDDEEVGQKTLISILKKFARFRLQAHFL